MTSVQLDAIREHGKQLLAIFPNARETDPVKLCKKLFALERQAHGIALRLCNGPEFASEDEVDALCDTLLVKVDNLLGNLSATKTITLKNGRIRNRVPIFLNRDPRGHAFKIDDGWMKLNNARLHRDWGGYGIIAPEIDKEGK